LAADQGQRSQRAFVDGPVLRCAHGG
jgi:hypothetical protein